MSYKIIPYLNFVPVIDKNSYIADGCIVTGAVTIGANSSIWFNAVLRGDVAPIYIGNNTNIQDGAVVHTSRFNGITNIGNDVTIGHLALIHACTVHDHAFVGMRAVVMDNAVIEEYGFIAAGAVITPNKRVKSKELWAGMPAKFIRHITEAEIEYMQSNIENYINLKNIYKSSN